jgi:SAM-dependent methyltransferase
MEQWYKAAAAAPGEMAAALEAEYRPLAAFLARLRGRVLDVGGGAGLAAMVLPGEVDYTVLDPYPVWDDPVCTRIRRILLDGGPVPAFVRGTAEHLPFADGRFEAVLALSSLNHVADPGRTIAELHRVLAHRGKALLVLEDMEPTWQDVTRLASQKLRDNLGMPVGDSAAWHHEQVTGIKATTLHKLSGRPWPIQSDHLRIERAELDEWLSDRFETAAIAWRGGYLTYELERLPA